MLWSLGLQVAILAGDFLLARASMSLAALHNTEVIVLLSQVIEHLVSGEILQVRAQRVHVWPTAAESLADTSAPHVRGCPAHEEPAREPALNPCLHFLYQSSRSDDACMQCPTRLVIRQCTFRAQKRVWQPGARLAGGRPPRRSGVPEGHLPCGHATPVLNISLRLQPS